jgi:hypothetical protein
MKKRTRSSTPIAAVDTPRSFRIPATSARASSSSCQTRTSVENLITSRARCSSNPGATYAGSPFAGMTSRNGRSLRPQRTSTKYAIDVPDSSTIAPMPCWLMRRCALAIRARRSSAVIGGAGFGRGFKPVIDAGTAVPCGRPRPCVAPTTPAIDVCTNARLEMSIAAPE